MFFQLFKNPMNKIDMIHFSNVDQNTVSIDNDKNIKLFGQDFVNIALETCWYIRQAK